MNKINLVAWKDDINTLLPKLSNNLLLISYSKMKELKLKKGSLLLLKSVEDELLLKVCPSELVEKSTAALLSSSLLKHCLDSQYTVELFKGHVSMAVRIVFSTDKYKKFMDSEAFIKYLKEKLDHMYLKEGMLLHLNYLEYPCYFTVKKITSCLFDENAQTENIPTVSGSFSLLEDSFNEKCNISKISRFHSSTPVSSPKIHSPQKCNLLPFDSFTDVENVNAKYKHSKFYQITMKTKVTVKNADFQNQNNIAFEEIGGLDEEIGAIKSSINLFLDQGSSSHNILIIGPSGTGKSMLLEAIQNEYEDQLYIYNIKNYIFTENVAAVLQKIFKEAIHQSPSLLLIDEIDKLCKNKDQPNNGQILKEETFEIIFNLLNSSADVMVIATCQNEFSVPASLRKHGLLNRDLRIPVTSPANRKQILKKILQNFEHNLTSYEISEVSDITHGFTGGDLYRLCKEVSISALMYCKENDFNDYNISFLDIQKSFKMKPASVTEFNFEKPNVKWSDIGGMDEVKNAVKEMIDWPLKYPEKLKHFKITPPRGILMYGPPGCCKTMIAKALANESQLNFLNVMSSQVFSKYVGDSEKFVSELFKKARAAAPCILFFDEIDSFASVRGSTNGNSNVTDRVVTQILIEIDGIDVLQQGVCVIAATNRPDRIDPSLMRPGRFDRLIYVPLPDAYTRRKIFQVILNKMPCSSDVDLQYLADKTENYTGAEISAVCLEACMSAMKEELSSVKMYHFITALESAQPRTTQEMLNVFENYHSKFKSY